MKGSCLCNAVSYEVNDSPKNPTCCHCIQCRKQSGHSWAGAHVPDSKLVIDGEVRWYASSEKAKRGFCPNCGSVLFWKHDDEESMSFSLGSVDGDTGLKLEQHIFMAYKGDYYDIVDDVPRYDIVKYDSQE